MKRLSIICCALLVTGLLAGTFGDATAAIKVKRIGRSSNQLPSGSPWNLASGLRAIGKGTRSYFQVDTTGSGQTGAPSWTLTSRPIGSNATMENLDGNFTNSITADVVGEYVVTATVGSQSASDTVFASTYYGVSSYPDAGCFCHPNAVSIKSGWQNTLHATIFTQGVTGNLEVEHGMGAYAGSCIKCHTIGYQTDAQNNNFYNLARATGWDTTWYQGLPYYNGDYWITTGDTSVYHTLTAEQRAMGTIGCESCHGPSFDHKLTADKKKIGVSMDAAVCNQCHDGSSRHSLGTYFNSSMHATLPQSEPAYNCQPCHTGAGFVYYMEHGKDTTGIRAVWDPNTDGMTKISCQACHDPHSSANPYQLRTMSLRGDSLRNGYVIPAGLRNKTGNLCANCHFSRYRTQDKVKPNSPPYFGFVDRYGPHGNPQADMYFGTSGYQFGDESFTGLMTHAGLEGGCATCHMQDRVRSGNTLPNHSFSMTDTTFGFRAVTVCKNCHGDIEDFNDVRAFYDYDRNGMIEGVQTEIAGLLAQLKSRLPQDPLTGEPVTRTKDSLLIKNNFSAVAGIWNYYIVVNDGSMGIHNTKYAVALLYKSLGWTPLNVKELPGVPKEFALNQNYPNPFNPSTTIRFALPTEGRVKLDVYDMTGALVKTIIDEAVRPGNMEVVWDGTNTNGTKVASGMYLYRIQAGNFTAVKKMIMLK